MGRSAVRVELWWCACAVEAQPNQCVHLGGWKAELFGACCAVCWLPVLSLFV